MIDRVLRDFDDEKDIRRIADTFHAWRGSDIVGAVLVPAQGDPCGRPYTDDPGFYKSVTLAEIRKHDYVLTPGRYGGAAAQENDGEPFEKKMAHLTAQMLSQFEKSTQLEKAIRTNLEALDYGG